MFDDRSFSSTSFDSRSWLFNIFVAVARKFRQWFVMTTQSDLFVFRKQDEINVKVKPNG